MTLRVIHSGLRVGQKVKDLEAFNGFYDPTNSIKNAYHASLIAGIICSLDANGFLKPCDGATENPIGILFNSFNEYDLGSNTTVADGGLMVFQGAFVVETDQIVTTLTYAPGDKLYAGTGANVGKITNVAPAATAKVIGIATSIASASNPKLIFNGNI